MKNYHSRIGLHKAQLTLIDN